MSVAVSMFGSAVQMTESCTRFRTPRLRDIAACLVVALFLALPDTTANATTTITGAEDTNAPLVVTPDTDPLVTPFDTAGIYAVGFIQRMPVSKTIARVTIGDFASSDACTTPAEVRLSVLEEPSGTFEGGSPLQLALSSDVALPADLGEVTFDLPTSVTLVKGKAYLFRITGDSTACRSARQRTWAHNGGQVDNGPDPCAGRPRLDVGMSGLPMRLWHSAGESDRVEECAGAQTFDPTMPTGWLLTTRSGGSRGIVSWQLPAGNAVPATGCSSFQGAGVHWVFWKTIESSGTTYDKWVCQWTQFTAPNATVSDGWYHGAPWVGARDGRPRDIYLRLDTIDYGVLLERYVPQLRYHFAESYRADSAWIATLPLPPFSGDADESNNLERESGAILAAADPLLGYPQLSLDMLPGRAATGELYPSGGPALDSDRIDFRNDSYQDDAAAMHANSGLANRVYARAVQGADGKLWLQYWFFYYYNEGILGFGDHEADWEMIQIGLKADLTPDIATYAQHSGTETCLWERVPKYNGPSGTAPVVFVELGSHASRFYADPVASYDAESGGERVRPTIEREIGNAEPGWANWRGRWGGSVTEINSPGEQSGPKWDDPTVFSTEGGCPAQASGAVTARRRSTAAVRWPHKRTPPAPRLTAKRSGQHVLIRFRYSRRQWKRLPRKAGLVLAVRGSTKKSLPRSVIFRIRHRAGRRQLALPLSASPYVVQGQTLTRAGAQSRPVAVPLHSP